MIRILTAAVVLTSFVACGSEPSRDRTVTGTSTATQTATDRVLQDERAVSSSGSSAQTVTLVGCLEGGAAQASYRLTRARPESPDSAGVGTSGAGASGGPLVSGATDFTLDGLPPNGTQAIGKQVRITGRLEAAPRGKSPSENGEVPAVTQGRAPQAGGTVTGNELSGADLGRRLAVDAIQVVGEACVPAP